VVVDAVMTMKFPLCCALTVGLGRPDSTCDSLVPDGCSSVPLMFSEVMAPVLWWILNTSPAPVVTV
jgi:hypothetical protein